MIRPLLLFAAVICAIAYLTPQYLDLTAGPPAAIEDAEARPTAEPARETGTGRRLRIAADRSGHFLVDAVIDGRTVDALIDTGATTVALRYEDARAMGLVRSAEGFDERVATANGIAKAKRVRLGRVRVGTLTVTGVDALVTEPGALGVNLLGMSFLHRLARFEIANGELLLER